MTDEQERALTTYIVLAYAQGSRSFAVVGTAKAASAKAAVRGLMGESAGVYVAVAERNWREVEIETEQVTNVTATEGGTKSLDGWNGYEPVAVPESEEAVA